MSSLSVPQRVASAAAVFCGRYGDVTRLANGRGASRQAVYRQARGVARALDPRPAKAALADLRQRLAQAQAEQARLRQRLAQATLLDDDQQAAFASTAQALGVSLSAARALLAVLVGKAAPSVARLGRLTQAGRRAAPTLAVLDKFARPRAQSRWPPTRSSPAKAGADDPRAAQPVLAGRAAGSHPRGGVGQGVGTARPTPNS